MHASAAAGPVHELVDDVHWVGEGLLFPLRKIFASVLAFCRHVAIACLAAVSAFTPMAQMNPSSSRPTAVTILRWSHPDDPSSPGPRPWWEPAWAPPPRTPPPTPSTANTAHTASDPPPDRPEAALLVPACSPACAPTRRGCQSPQTAYFTILLGDRLQTRHR